MTLIHSFILTCPGIYYSPCNIPHEAKVRNENVAIIMQSHALENVISTSTVIVMDFITGRHGLSMRVIWNRSTQDILVTLSYCYA